MIMEPPSAPLRIVVFCVLPFCLELLEKWADNHGHDILFVISADRCILPTNRREKGFAPVDLEDSLSSTASLAPDLILCFSFPWRIPLSLCDVSVHGGINLHPSALPAFRGPNPMRSVYENYPEIGASVHWISEAFDQGNILGRKTCPLPVPLTPTNLLEAWKPLMITALSEGVERACRDDPGVPQEEFLASYGGHFTREERWLDWNNSVHELQCKHTALTFLSLGEAYGRIDGESYFIRKLRQYVMGCRIAEPGTVLASNYNGFRIQVADGQIEVDVSAVNDMLE